MKGLPLVVQLLDRVSMSLNYMTTVPKKKLLKPVCRFLTRFNVYFNNNSPARAFQVSFQGIPSGAVIQVMSLLWKDRATYAPQYLDRRDALTGRINEMAKVVSSKKEA